MGLFDKLFKRKSSGKADGSPERSPDPGSYKNPEDDFTITITGELVKVQHPKRKEESIRWADIEEIRMINTDSGPWLPDVWLALMGKENGCLVPQGAKGFDEVYDLVSQYEGFDFKAVIESMSCTGNAQFILWKRKE